MSDTHHDKHQHGHGHQHGHEGHQHGHEGHQHGHEGHQHGHGGHHGHEGHQHHGGHHGHEGHQHGNVNPKSFQLAHYSPAFFDIKQDVSGTLPVKVIEKWLKTDQSEHASIEILNEYKVKGYSVSSDTAGLTALTKSKGLLQILSIINKPKEIVYSYGKHVGGEGVGVWAADNTRMFYPDSVHAETLVSALLTVQKEIAKHAQVKIGIGAHLDNFYYLNGGLYGEKADEIEEFAENETEGGQVVITQAIVDRLPHGHHFKLQEVPNDKHASIGKVYLVVDGPTLTEQPQVDKYYPIPYSKEFYDDLLGYEGKLDDAEYTKKIEGKYVKEATVVLTERESDENKEDFAILESLARTAVMKDAGCKLLHGKNGTEIKVVGNLGIYTFEHASDAIQFAKDFKHELTSGKHVVEDKLKPINTRTGIDIGPVLVFELPVGGKDIAGGAVNVASKISQDKGEFGKIYLSSGMKNHVDVSTFQELKYTVSNVEMVTYVVT